MKRLPWLGIPAAAAVALTLFALTAGIGSARAAAAPSNSSPPTISGTAQVGQLLTADKGTWTGTGTITYAYQWRICGTNGGACRDIAGATGTEYSVKAADQGNTIRIQVTATNADGSTTATSVPSALIAAASVPAPAPAPTGCPKLAAGATAAAVTDVSPPARLLLDQIQASPSVITRGTGAFTVRFHVSSTCGNPVQGAQVYATGVPYNMISIPAQQTTDANGWVSLQFQTMRGFPATPQQQLLVMFVRATKPGDNTLAGVSTRRLVSLHVNLHG